MASCASCLFALDEVDLRAVLRAAVRRRRSLAAVIERCVAAKWAGHMVEPGAVHPPAALDEPDRRLTAAGASRSPRSARRPVHLDSGPCPTAGSPTSIRWVVPAWSTSRRRRPPTGGRWPEAGCSCSPTPTSLVARGAITKGDVLAVARVAGIQAAKRTPDLIPLCHPLLVGAVLVNFRIEDTYIEVEAQVDTVDRTGVEMEAMTACSVAR